MRERAGWLLRDALTTLALILAEKEEVSRLERAINTGWLDLEADRRERFVAVSYFGVIGYTMYGEEGCRDGDGARHEYRLDPVGVFEYGGGAVD